MTDQQLIAARAAIDEHRRIAEGHSKVGPRENQMVAATAFIVLTAISSAIAAALTVSEVAKK